MFENQRKWRLIFRNSALLSRLIDVSHISSRNTPRLLAIHNHTKYMENINFVSSDRSLWTLRLVAKMWKYLAFLDLPSKVVSWHISWLWLLKLRFYSFSTLLRGQQKFARFYRRSSFFSIEKCDRLAKHLFIAWQEPEGALGFFSRSFATMCCQELVFRKLCHFSDPSIGDEEYIENGPHLVLRFLIKSR